MLDLFTQLTAIIVIASVLGIFARWAKQPTILAYLIAGILVGVFGFFELSHDTEVYRIFSDLGIMFLLFLVGLEINYSSLRAVGRDSFIVGIGQVLFTFIIGFGIALLFAFSLLSSFYIALALTFSSTIIVVNLLYEKKDLNNVYGKVSLGMLLVQDIIVVIALVLLAGVSGGEGVANSQFLSKIFGNGTLLVVSSVVVTLIKAFLVFYIAFALSKRFIPKLFATIAKSPELIFLTSLAWLFSLTWIIDAFGFSKEIGGFLAGLTLANSYEHYQIAHRIKSLRDFFILVFFVILGASLIVFSSFSGIILPIIIFSLFILIGNPFIVFLLMAFLGYRKKPSFFAGVLIAQISEFSLILAALGVSLGHISNSIATLITAVGVITIITSTYLILYVDKLYAWLAPYLSYFERKNTKYTSGEIGMHKKPIVLVGFQRTGQSIAYNLLKDDIMVIDYDPEMVELLERDGFTHVFGEMNDEDVLALIDFSAVRVVISTAPDVDSNVVFIKNIVRIRNKLNASFRIIARARTDRDATALYKAGADYVLLPHTTAGRFLAKTIATDPFLHGITAVREKDLNILRTYKRDLG